MSYTADSLITSVKRRAGIPTAQNAFLTADFLSLADEEMASFVLPLVRRTREDYFLQGIDFAVTSANAQGATGPYRIPYRAVGGALRDVYALDDSGNILQVPRISSDDLEQAAWGIYTVGSVLYFMNRRPYSVPTTLRMMYFLRPNQLVLEASAGTITNIATATKTVTLSAVPASFSGQTTFDLVQGRPGFDTLAFDFSGTVVGSTVVFGSALPSDLSVGDYVCLPEESPVPQIPAELHPLLAQRVAVKFLESQGDQQGLSAAAQVLARMESDALTLLSPRIEGTPKKLIPRGGAWRRGRRW